MKLKKWPTDERSYLQAIRQITKFIEFFKTTHENPDKFDDYTEAIEIYCKLLRDVYDKYHIHSSEEFWKWCYTIAAAQLVDLEEKSL